MTTKLEYTPDIGIKINSMTINWFTNRETVRNLLGQPSEQQDRVIDLGENLKVESRRDIYKNIYAGDNYIFLNYNTDNALTELEVHWGVDITVKDIKLDFNSNIQENITALAKLTDNFKEIETGNFLFPTLKLTIADHESLGGDGHELGYFYASTDISHLLEE
jgi:hypothetical protein